MSEFSHLDASGAPRMVDVGAKSETKRTAIARAVVELNAHTLELLKAKALPKGDVLTVAQVAGIMAAKRTSELIPMCHPLAITHADVRFRVQDEPPSVLLEASASTTGRTGVEMEAIIAAQVAAATIYDMVKAVQKDVVIRDVRLCSRPTIRCFSKWRTAPSPPRALRRNPGRAKALPWPASPFRTRAMPEKGSMKAALRFWTCSPPSILQRRNSSICRTTRALCADW